MWMWCKVVRWGDGALAVQAVLAVLVVMAAIEAYER
jgi:hypothetical protein